MAAACAAFIRARSSIAYLGQFARIRGEPALDLGAGFDLITGTSTGAIVGCALAVGRPMARVVSLYREHGHEIFPHRIKGKPSASTGHSGAPMSAEGDRGAAQVARRRPRRRSPCSTSSMVAEFRCRFPPC